MNNFLTTDWLTMESLRRLLNKLEITEAFDTSYNSEFQKEFPVGDSVRIKLPWRPEIRDGLGYTPQNIDRIYTTVNIEDPFGIDFEWDSVEKALKMERGKEMLAEEYLDPAMDKIKQEIESRAALFAKNNTSNIVGVLGTDPSTFQSVSGASRQRLIEMAALDGKRRMFIPPSVNTALAAVASNFFNPAPEISRIYKQGSLGMQGGFEWFESMSLYEHTAGTWQGAVTVDGANQSGTALNIACTTGDTFKQGDKFGIGNVYKVNPMTRRITSRASTATFTVQEDVTAAGATATLSILPAIFGPASPYQNVNVLPANGATLTLFPGTSSPNGKTGKVGLAIAPKAFALVAVPMEVPKAVEVGMQTRDPKTGIAIRFVRAWDQQQSKMTNRFDVMIGFGNLWQDNDAVAVLCGS